jgi:hypothetical protein
VIRKVAPVLRTPTRSAREARCGVQTTGRSRRLADDGRHLTDPSIRFAGIFVGILNAAPVVTFSVAQHCRCGGDSCEACGGYQLTPRTAVVLWTVAQILAEQGYDDVSQHGDEPVVDDNAWALFSRYPPITWRQDAVWRRQAARSYDDLSGDVAAGRWPLPRCPGEEIALHLVLQDAATAVEDGWAGLDETLPQLPEHPDDHDWDTAGEVLFQDHDILDLFDVQMDGIEDPDSEHNRAMGIGDYRPQAWFRTFLNRNPRDGRRTFRR